MSYDLALRAVLQLLDQWRHLPAYQLERRVDVFFASIIRDYIAADDRIPLQLEVLPEFPISSGLRIPSRDDLQSDRVDFVMVAQNLSVVYFVELKTDMGSIRPDQHSNLSACEGRRFGEFLRHILAAARTTEEPGKYHYLLHALAEAGFLALPFDLKDFTFPRKRGYRQRLRGIRILREDSQVVARYVQPQGTASQSEIDFSQLAGFLRVRGDQFSLEFAQLLDRWCAPPAFGPPAKPTPPPA